LDILVCPFDKVSALELIVFKIRSNTSTESSGSSSLTNQDAITKDGVNMETNKTNHQDSPMTTSSLSSEIIQEGLLLCRICMRFYPITEEIPIILPDELRDKKNDIQFLKTWKESIPNDLLKNLKPWTL
jgi:uncharacterized protein YbaR (Trm112 family)